MIRHGMSAHAVADHLCNAIRSGDYAFIVCNFANGDMVGHTGNLNAAIQAVETLDACLKKVADAAKDSGGQLLITADHGNVELMVDPNSGQPHTSHTNWPVALIYDGPRKASLTLADGALCDLAPTLLDLMDIDKPSEMTGSSLASH